MTYKCERDIQTAHVAKLDVFENNIFGIHALCTFEHITAKSQVQDSRHDVTDVYDRDVINVHTKSLISFGPHKIKFQKWGKRIKQPI